MLSSITIAGQPIAFDWQCKLREFLRDRLPAEEVLFARWMPEPKMHAAVIEKEALTPPYPALHPIEVGELQWPSGASRYARALYVVDKVSLLNIAIAAWDLDVIAQGGPDAITDYLSNWGAGATIPGAVSSVELSIYGEEHFVSQMLPLPPYRIPGTGAELWLLPLVDRRFLWQQIPYEPDGYASSWAGLFDDLATTIGTPIAYAAVPSEYGVPDRFVIQPGVSATALLDCAALSIGRRIVIDPNSSVLRLMTAADSNTRCTATIAKSTIVAGSFRGKAVLPSHVAVFCRKANEFSLACNSQEKRTAVVGDGAFTHLAHSAWIVDERMFGGSLVKMNATDTGYYVAKVADDMATWLNSGGQYAFAGAIMYAPSGYDDYLTIKAAEVEPEVYWFSSRVYELPAVFLPNLLLSQYSGIRIASIVEQFVAKDQNTDPGLAHFSDNSSHTVGVTGLTSADSGLAISAFYRCGLGWTKISSSAVAGGSTPELFVFTLTSDLAKTRGSTATANAMPANATSGATTAITVTNPGQFRTFTGAMGVAIKLSSTLYWILVVDQPALRVSVVLDVHPNHSVGAPRYGADPREDNAAIKLASIDAPYALTPFPFSFMRDFSSGLVPNPRDKFGESGDKGIIEWDPVADAYFLSEVQPQRQQEVWAELSTARPNGLGQAMSCTPATPASDGSMPASPFTVTDTFNVAINAKSGNRLLAKWDASSAGYRAIASQRTATRCKAKIYSSFSGGSTTIQVYQVAGMDGTTPTFTTSLAVNNRFGWDSGVAGADIEIVWDTHLGEWYAVQMDCPP